MDYEYIQEICSKMLSALFKENQNYTISFLQEWIQEYGLDHHFMDEDKCWDENECWDGFDLDDVSDKDLLREMENRGILKIPLKGLSITQESFLDEQIEKIIKKEII